MRFPVQMMLAAALLTVGAAPTLAASLPPASGLTENSVERLALEWFDRMRTGQIDRTQLAADYSAQLTGDAVQAMSLYLKAHDFGTPPTDAQVLRTRAIGEQTLYVVKLLFPRGDAASLLLGFNTAGKITGVTLMSIAGD